MSTRRHNPTQPHQRRVRSSASTTLHTCAAACVLALTPACGQPSLADRVEGELRALNTLHDLEVAETASEALLARLEAAHLREPHEGALLRLLTRRWVEHALLFVTPAEERAVVEGRVADERYHARRVRGALARARWFGFEWLSTHGDRVTAEDLNDEAGVERATASLDANDATALAWLSFALDELERRDTEPHQGASAAKRSATWLAQRALALDPNTNTGVASLIVDRDRVLADPKREDWQVWMLAALRVHCERGDHEGLLHALNDLVARSEPESSLRLANAVARERARLYLVSQALWERCASDGSGHHAPGESK